MEVNAGETVFTLWQHELKHKILRSVYQLESEPPIDAYAELPCDNGHGSEIRWKVRQTMEYTDAPFWNDESSWEPFLAMIDGLTEAHRAELTPELVANLRAVVDGTATVVGTGPAKGPGGLSISDNGDIVVVEEN